jgi:hypothetical protein
MVYGKAERKSSIILPTTLGAGTYVSNLVRDAAWKEKESILKQ